MRRTAKQDMKNLYMFLAVYCTYCILNKIVSPLKSYRYICQCLPKRFVPWFFLLFDKILTTDLNNYMCCPTRVCNLSIFSACKNQGWKVLGGNFEYCGWLREYYSSHDDMISLLLKIWSCGMNGMSRLFLYYSDIR